MKIFKLIKEGVCKFFHPSFHDMMCRVGIMEDFSMSDEEYYRCVKMIEEKRRELASKDISKKEEKDLCE